MDKQFTASEVRIVANHIGHYPGGRRAEAMLNAYADRLEADEKAVPEAWQYFLGEHWYTVGSDEPWRSKGMPVRKLYAHPAPADAERLAEALEIIDGWMELYDHQGTGSSRDASRSEKEWAADRTKLVALLGAHTV